MAVGPTRDKDTGPHPWFPQGGRCRGQATVGRARPGGASSAPEAKACSVESEEMAWGQRPRMNSAAVTASRGWGRGCCSRWPCLGVAQAAAATEEMLGQLIQESIQVICGVQGGDSTVAPGGTHRLCCLTAVPRLTVGGHARPHPSREQGDLLVLHPEPKCLERGRVPGETWKPSNVSGSAGGGNSRAPKGIPLSTTAQKLGG